MLGSLVGCAYGFGLRKLASLDVAGFGVMRAGFIFSCLSL